MLEALIDKVKELEKENEKMKQRMDVLEKENKNMKLRLDQIEKNETKRGILQSTATEGFVDLPSESGALYSREELKHLMESDINPRIKFNGPQTSPDDFDTI